MTVQTLTDELLGEIEACAAKATPGQWWIDSHGHTMIAQESLDVIFSIPFVKGAAVRHPETGNLSQWRNDWDASYIALANPANVTALITELRTLRAEVKVLQSDANSWQYGYDEGRRMAGKHRISEIEQLRAENAELRKDAGRYRWLRLRVNVDSYGLSLPCGNSAYHPCKTDLSIYTAMEQAK